MVKQLRTVRTRIAPSPTGENLHIGNVYTALINYAWAKKHNGQFIVRIEDTDQKRKVKGSEEKILESLKWFGLNPDEEIVHQSERLDIYKKYAEELVEKDHAYYCDCSSERLETARKEMQKKGVPPKYDRYCLNRQKEIDKSKAVIRMKIPDEYKGEHAVSWDDVIRDFILVEFKVLDDQVILKSDGYPTYHLAVVVDDHLMEISHVIRAEEWISSTPKHILLYNFFGWKQPQFAHVPILRNPDKSKLSKRRNPVWANWYRKEGFLPEAILNYLATLGWSHPQGKDIFNLDEFIDKIELTNIQTTGPVFDIVKLEWFNGEYIRSKPIQELGELLYQCINTLVHEPSKDLVMKTVPLIQTRIKKLSEYWPLCEFFFKCPTSFEKEIDKEWMKKVTERLSLLSRWTHDTLYRELAELAQSFGSSKSKFFMDIRIAVTGKKIGPPLFESMEVLGKEESIERLKSAI